MRTATFTCIAALMVAVSGCSDKPEAVMEEMVSTINEAGAALETVKDEASAIVAAARIDGLAVKLKAIKERSAAIKTSEGKRAELEQAYTGPLAAAGGRVGQALVAALQVPGAQKHLEPAVQKFMSLMN